MQREEVSSGRISHLTAEKGKREIYRGDPTVMVGWLTVGKKSGLHDGST